MELRTISTLWSLNFFVYYDQAELVHDLMKFARQLHFDQWRQKMQNALEILVFISAFFTIGSEQTLLVTQDLKLSQSVNLPLFCCFNPPKPVTFDKTFCASSSFRRPLKICMMIPAKRTVCFQTSWFGFQHYVRTSDCSNQKCPILSQRTYSRTAQLASSGSDDVSDQVVEFGDVVTMNFIGSFLDGVEFESTRDGEPMEFEIGAGKVVKGIENMVRRLFFTYSSRV